MSNRLYGSKRKLENTCIRLETIYRKVYQLFSLSTSRILLEQKYWYKKSPEKSKMLVEKYNMTQKRREKK